MRVFRLGLFMVAGCAAVVHAVVVQAQVPPPSEQKPPAEPTEQQPPPQTAPPGQQKPPPEPSQAPAPVAPLPKLEVIAPKKKVPPLAPPKTAPPPTVVAPPAPAPVQKTPTPLPEVEVVAPKKKAPAPAAPPKPAPPAAVVAPAPAPAQKTPTPLPEVEVVAPKQKAPAPAAPPKPAPAPLAAAEPPAWAGTLEVRMSPVGGSELPIEKVPAGISVVNAGDILRTASPAITEAIAARVPSATTNEALGNALAADLQFRGFVASPLNGTPQGLAVYLNGVRINEVFGDSVNWDLIPVISINDIILMSNNPVYGLNALGGAVNVIMKDGFTFQGITIDSRFGSFGHKEVTAEAGQRVGNWAAYIAGEWIDETGWRDLSPAEAKRAYADIGLKTPDAEFHFNYTFGNTFLGVVGPTPAELVDQRRASVFTSPQTFDNLAHLLNLTGAVAVSDTLKLSGNAYYRSFSQRRPDGNVSEAIACDPSGPNAGLLCFEEPDDVLFGRRRDGTIVNVPISSLPKGMDTILGGNDSVAVDSFSYGGTLQAVSKARLFERPNQFLVGASVDLGRAHVKSQSELGVLNPRTLVVSGLGIIIDQSLNPNLDEGDVEVTPVNLITRTQYYGLYFLNTLDVTERLAFTVGGRYNLANLKLEDQLGTALNGNHTFQRFNPMVGVTYKLVPGVSFYTGYSESNRAPTPAELSCADPERPCLLENFLVSDPPLKQVVGRTVEAGLRGEFAAGYAGRDVLGAPKFNTIGWSVGYFRTLLSDDILTVASPIQGRGFFINGGDTLREGVEVAANYRSQQLFAYLGYAFVNATFQNALQIASPDAPVGVPCSAFEPADGEDEVPNCANVRPGDRIPGIPQHRFKVGFDYWMTPQWRIGADLIAVSSQFFRGDEGNADAPLGGYTIVNLRTGYKVTDNVELYGIVRNLFDRDYATFGTYFDAEALRTVGGVAVGVGPNGTVLENPRTITPAAPLAVYGGVRVRF
jgi:outer membrane receptor protein involved in Fe transport